MPHLVDMRQAASSKRCTWSPRQSQRGPHLFEFLPAPRGKTWPRYDICVQGAPPKRGTDEPDISRADFTWCITAIDWGWDIESTDDELMQRSTKAQENGDRYALLTAQNAAAAVERNRRSRA
jgi:hypothetical protein